MSLKDNHSPLSSPSGAAKEICKKLDKGDESAKSLTFIQYPLLEPSGRANEDEGPQ